jgi:hypothetical protein
MAISTVFGGKMTASRLLITPLFSVLLLAPPWPRRNRHEEHHQRLVRQERPVASHLALPSASEIFTTLRT